ncbi:MAG: hypothetical protein NXI24_08830 [bacterium]|nr:hypothetical protein [bacterium]
MKKIIIIIGSVLGGILVLLLGVSLYVSSLLTEEFVVQQIESNFNLRAELKELDVGLFSGASVQLKGVALGPRDSVANQGKPLGERKPMKNKVISAESMELSLQLMPLLDSQLVVEKFIFDQPVLNLAMRANGTNNMGSLFKTPRVVDGKRNPALDEKPASASNTNEPFRAADLGIAGELEKVGLNDGTLNLRLASGDRLKFKQLNLYLTDIVVDAADLENKNSANLELDTNVFVTSRASGKEIAQFILRSDGEIQPFDPKTGEVALNLRYDLTMKESSFMTGFAVMDQLAGRLPDLKKAGVDMKEIAKKAELIRDVEVDLEYGRGLLKILNDPTFPTRHYDLAILKGSTIKLGDSTHRFKGSVLASENETNKAFKNLDEEIKRALKGTSVDPVELRNKALNKIIKDGRIHLDFTSKGALRNPNVDLLVNLPELSDIIKSAGGDILKGKLDAEINKVLPGGAGEQGKKLIDDALNKLPF